MAKRSGFRPLPLHGEDFILIDEIRDFETPPAAFDALWHQHPAAYPKIRMMGKTIPTPRWQQAYLQDYAFAGEVSRAAPMPPGLECYLEWLRLHVDRRLNGLLLNWYDGRHRHYIGRHRDKTAGLVAGSPIATVSLGEERTLRMRPHHGKGYIDFRLQHHSVVVIPYHINRDYYHEVPPSTHEGRRISVTARVFETNGPGESTARRRQGLRFA
ncbi:MAG: alpha-ketoglutarate-dependent dioxygenase AlkB [Proteobacteria bacterium]|jgi:alkylated DNA repair dioxygenase AlkB|nr:alpha-ketoglutarate-dependent dioxygenase AlkB [Pseudomonadota bacterium]